MAATNWSNGDVDRHLQLVRASERPALGAVARDYDWDQYPEPVLGWVMAQQTVDLHSALATFFNGAPERFNYLHKRDVPEEFHGTCRVLDNICLRINSGFYLMVEPGEGIAPLDEALATRLRNWLLAQREDRGEGSLGRWVLDEAMMAPVLDPEALTSPRRRPVTRSEPISVAVSRRLSGQARLPELAPPAETPPEEARTEDRKAEAGGSGIARVLAQGVWMLHPLACKLHGLRRKLSKTRG
ncbi:hypothetical protein ACM25N_05500 [Roseovarius sp. C7]|uniref:hypothetical protein n=1 Tax=Roseovarius sp. C7 TaxID=3398643 RepID=UPI0039F670F7